MVHVMIQFHFILASLESSFTSALMDIIPWVLYSSSIAISCLEGIRVLICGYRQYKSLGWALHLYSLALSSRW
jgi:hypothetical protein